MSEYEFNEIFVKFKQPEDDAFNVRVVCPESGGFKVPHNMAATILQCYHYQRSGRRRWQFFGNWRLFYDVNRGLGEHRRRAIYEGFCAAFNRLRIGDYDRT